MKRHVVVVHEGRKRFKCEICNAERKERNLNVDTWHAGFRQKAL